jgi:hypothetical protein
MVREGGLQGQAPSKANGEDDLAFRFRLFCDSRAPEFALLSQQVGRTRKPVPYR